MKELLPVVLVVALWGWQWTHCQVMVQCDNMAVVSVINKPNMQGADKATPYAMPTFIHGPIRLQITGRAHSGGIKCSS